MEIVGYEKSRVLRFLHVFRAQGAFFVPEAFAKIIARYGFARFPTLDDLKKEVPIVFETGKFEDVQIDELTIYADGYAAVGRCSTELLDRFLDDVLAWASQEFGITFVMNHRNEVHYENMVIVKASADLASIFRPAIAQPIAESLARLTGIQYQPSGLVFDCDPREVNASDKKRKPWRLFIERRIGFPFEENLFLCQAPLSTPQFLQMLQALEAAIVERRI